MKQKKYVWTKDNSPHLNGFERWTLNTSIFTFILVVLLVDAAIILLVGLPLRWWM